MPQRINSPAWRSSNRACAFLSLIPIFGFFGLLFMGRKSGRKQYTDLGAVYGLLSIAAFAATVISDFMDRIRWDDSVKQKAYLVEDMLGVYGSLAQFLLWIVCLIHTLCLSSQYLNYLALKQSVTPGRSPLTVREQWRTINLLWMIWSYLPYMGGFSLIFAGRRMKKSGLTISGVIALAATWGLEMASAVAYRLTGNGLGNALENLAAWCMFGLWIGLMLVAFLIREEYLDTRAAQWTAATSRRNVLAEGGWRAANSRWQIWTYFPYVGGVGIFVAAIRSRRKDWALYGALLTAAAIGLMATSLSLQSTYYDLVFTDAAIPYRAAIDALEWVAGLCYFVTLFSGCCFRWEALVAKAEALGGYRTEFDRDLAMHNRMPSRPVAPVQPRYRIPAQPPVQPPAPPKKETPVDINRCTQQELMTLPGVGIVEAKQAIEYRSEWGGFRSVDEFVDVLKIKPHFAVQLFSRATASPMRPPKPAAEAIPVRRRIDF